MPFPKMILRKFCLHLYARASLLLCSLLLPLSSQFYLKSQPSDAQKPRWGLQLLSATRERPAPSQLSRRGDFNLSDDGLQRNHNSGGGVHFSITNSLDVLRERMLGAIRRNNRKSEVA